MRQARACPGATRAEDHGRHSRHPLRRLGHAALAGSRDRGENQSVYVPLGAVHPLENPGKLDLHLIEVQSGPYLGEDDIVRIEDIYARA
jgi:mannose-1-phosphate guanylyltransferase/mannose-6-phosphate isomerase